MIKQVRYSLDMTDVKYLEIKDGTRLAYQHVPAQEGRSGLGVFFLHGHNSDMFGSKAEALMQWALAAGIGFTRLDYFGHGSSDGKAIDGTISRWTSDALAVLDACNAGPQILVGSSLGGWIMLNLAIQRPKQIAGLIGIAAAPDFTEQLIWSILTPSQRTEMQETGQIRLADPYNEAGVVYSYDLVLDGRKNLCLQQPIPFDGPVVLHHGLADTDVPWQLALDIAGKLTSPDVPSPDVPSPDVQINLVKAAGHRFSAPDQMEMIIHSVANMHKKLCAQN